jgi:hypothetical protein
MMTIALSFIFWLLARPLAAQDPANSHLQPQGGNLLADQLTTTGPVPPPGVLAPPPPDPTRVSTTIAAVPDYLWRHGCAPSSVGMVTGYWDIIGFSDLIAGDPSSQTDSVNQAIASGGDALNPYPPGSEQHYEDYSRPEDSSPGPILDDDYITQGRTPHTDNSIADFMDTSKSTRSLYYGWTWNDDIERAFEDYVSLRSPDYQGNATSLYFGSSLTWSVLTSEIDNGCPMVFVVDVDGDGETDHAVTVIGYSDDSGIQEYGCRDTWSPLDIRWEEFREMSSGDPWGISRGWKFRINCDYYVWVDFDYSGTETGTFDQPFNTLSEAVDAALVGDTIFIKHGSSLETITISKEVTLKSFGGSAVIGG